MPFHSVAVACDQAIYMRGLASMLLTIPELQLVGEARNGAEAVQLCSMTQPDLFVLDLRRAPDHGREVAKQARQANPNLCIVLMADDPAEISVPDEPGARSVYSISHNVSEDEFRSALFNICQDSAARGGQASFPHIADEEELEEMPFTRPAQSSSEAAMASELTTAGKIQADMLPEREPSIPGWDIAARLVPARETSGDFYDFIPLTEHKWGTVIGDVTDKGLGAALFMMFASSLIRTYAARFPTLPALVMNSVSERILNDSRGGMFVTCLFGVLEPHTGRFIFANAGHPPGLHISPQRAHSAISHLRPTGMAVGVSEDAQWKQKIIRLAPGDILVLYTDGITEAQNHRGDFFGEDRLLDVLLSSTAYSAGEIRDAVLAEIQHFSGRGPQQDDIALVVIRRKE